MSCSRGLFGSVFTPIQKLVCVLEITNRACGYVKRGPGACRYVFLYSLQCVRKPFAVGHENIGSRKRIGRATQEGYCTVKRFLWCTYRSTSTKGPSQEELLKRRHIPLDFVVDSESSTAHSMCERA